MASLTDLTGKDVLRYGDDISILTVTYGKTEFVDYMLSSLFKCLGRMLPVVVVNNIECYVPSKHKSWITSVDNKDHLLSEKYCYGKKGVFSYPSNNHSAAIEVGLKELVKTRWCMLCDDDILFKPEINDLLNMPAAWNCVGEIGKSTSHKHTGSRLFPFMCIIDIKKYRDGGIRYFDVDDNPGSSKRDTGGHFLKEINNHGWKIKPISLSDFIVHIGHGTLVSWHKDGPSVNELEQSYKEMWE